MIRLINWRGDPEYIRAEDVRRIYYHDSFKRVEVDLGPDTFHGPVELSVDEIHKAIFEIAEIQS